MAVLIGRSEPKEGVERADDPIDRLYNQLRMRRLAQEQVLTFREQQQAANALKQLTAAQAGAEKQMEQTQTRIDVQVAENRGDAKLAEAKRLAECDVTRASGESRSNELKGAGEAARVGQVGQAEAEVATLEVRAWGDARLLALVKAAAELAHSEQPLVPERLLVMGGGEGEGMDPSGMFGRLLTLLVAGQAGMPMGEAAGLSGAAAVADPFLEEEEEVLEPVHGPYAQEVEFQRADADSEVVSLIAEVELEEWCEPTGVAH